MSACMLCYPCTMESHWALPDLSSESLRHLNIDTPASVANTARSSQTSRNLPRAAEAAPRVFSCSSGRRLMHSNPLSLTHRPTYPTSEWGAPPHWAGVPSLRSPRRSSNSAARGTGCNPDRRIRRIRPPNNPRASAMVLRLGSPTRAIPQYRTQAQGAYTKP